MFTESVNSTLLLNCLINDISARSALTMFPIKKDINFHFLSFLTIVLWSTLTDCSFGLILIFITVATLFLPVEVSEDFPVNYLSKIYVNY